MGVKPAKSTKPTAPTLLGSGRVLSTEETMRLFGYDDTTSFWQAVRRAGIPFVRISPRRAIFRERDLDAYFDSRTVGASMRSIGGAA